MSSQLERRRALSRLTRRNPVEFDRVMQLWEHVLVRRRRNPKSSRRYVATGGETPALRLQCKGLTVSRCDCFEKFSTASLVEHVRACIKLQSKVACEHCGGKVLLQRYEEHLRSCWADRGPGHSIFALQGGLPSLGKKR
jgi:hypothetical protein